jgi:hypothetical protein
MEQVQCGNACGTAVGPLWKAIGAIMSVAALSLSGGVSAGEEAVSRAAIVERVRADVEFLASDALEGRGIDTPGIETAAKRIIAEYERLGLKPGMPDGTWRQPFPVTMGDVVVVPEKTVLTLTGPDGLQIRPARGTDYQPIRRGANGRASGGLVFIGYGISSDEDHYDDYAGINVEGRIVVMIRREPQQGRDGGAFNGTQTTSHSYVDRKLELIAKSKAAGIVFVNDPYSAPTPDKDELTPPSGFGNDGSSVPFVHVKQEVIDRILQVAPLKVEGDRRLKSVAEAAAWIDETLKPLSQELTGWNAEVATEFRVNTITADNLIGVIEGEGPQADQTIVIGGHYDHLGYGGFGSRAPNRRGEIHNGADDNATGTAAVLEMARRVAAGPKPRHRMVFICFSAEERGLIGSNYYVRHPAYPLDNTVFMLNFDMIGNLRNNRVEVNGVGSAAEFEKLVREADDASPLDVTVVENPFGGSDHLPFYQRKIPVMFCFTGLTSTYHTPDDDYAGLNIEGTVSVIDYSEQLLRAVDAMDARPTYREVSRTRTRPARIPFLGIAPELSDFDGEGVLVRTVREESPAKAAGIQVGDILLKVGDRKLESYQNLIEILTGSKAGDQLKVVLKRGEVEIETVVELGAPRG